MFHAKGTRGKPRRVWTDGHISLIIVQFWAGCVSQVVLWGALAVVAVASIAFVAVVPRGITPQARILPQTGKCFFLCKPASICSWVQWVRSSSLTRLRWAEPCRQFAAFATLDGCSSAQVTQQLDAVLCIPATDQECHKCADNCKKFAEMKKARRTPLRARLLYPRMPPTRLPGGYRLRVVCACTRRSRCGCRKTA